MIEARAREGNRTENSWKMLAFLARYGHQNMVSWLTRPVPELYAAVNALARVLEEEQAAARSAYNT